MYEKSLRYFSERFGIPQKKKEETFFWGRVTSDKKSEPGRHIMNHFYWAILAACIWGVVPIFEKMGLNNVSPFVGLFYRSLGVILGLMFLGIGFLKTDALKHVDLKTVSLLVLSGFLASFVAQICFYHGLKLGEVSKVVPIAGSFPLISFLLGVLIFKETVTPYKIAGIVFIVSGIWLLKG